jgi:hypothetical protein
MDEFADLEALQQEVRADVGQFRAADRRGRDEVHDRQPVAAWKPSDVGGVR